MSSELTILAVYSLFTILLILVQVLAAQNQVGIEMLVHPREDMPRLTGLAGRLDRAQMNSIVALALFAPAVLTLQAKAAFTPATLVAAQVFLVARILYAIFYASGTPWVRTLSWVVAFLATAWLWIATL
jgi:uncharacterized MAPEG superfamily protein